MKIRTVRFTSQEDAVIDAFLKKNPIFDFSTLTKTAIFRFVEKPELILKAVRKEKPVSRRRDTHVSV
jgi:hypothetical protein